MKKARLPKEPGFFASGEISNGGGEISCLPVVYWCITLIIRLCKIVLDNAPEPLPNTIET